MISQVELLKQAFMMIVGSKVCPKTPIRDWVKILLFTHKKGYLYAQCDDNKLNMVACMYKVSELTKKNEDVYPEKEKGNILYIPFFVSKSKDKLLANKIFKNYIAQHPEIKEIAFYERGDDTKLRRFKRKGVKHG